MYIKQNSKGTKGYIINFKSILPLPQLPGKPCLSTKVTTVTSPLYLSRDAYTNTLIHIQINKPTNSSKLYTLLCILLFFKT